MRAQYTSQIIQAATRVADAPSMDAFYPAVQQVYGVLKEVLFGLDEATAHDALMDALKQSQSNVRLRRAIEVAALPLYDKPMLPEPAPGVQEVLWMFALPVTVQFDESLIGSGLKVLAGDVFDGHALAKQLRALDLFREDLQVRLTTALWQREDLFAWGPETLAQQMLACELFDAGLPQSLPISFSEVLPVYRSVSLFMLGCVRVPVTAGVKSLYNRTLTAQELEGLAETFRAGLAAAGVPPERVEVHEPCSLSTFYYASCEQYQRSVQMVLEDAKSTGAVSAYVKFPTPGYVEVVVTNEQGFEIQATPPTSFVEPKSAVLEAFAISIARAGLKYAGSRANVMMSSSQHH